MSEGARRGIIFVVSGPSGVGKSSILRELLKRDTALRFSVSHTTRSPRASEVDGEHYSFVDRDEFHRMIDADEFLESAEYQGHLYGTSRQAVFGPVAAGIDLILEVEVQGAAQLRERLPEALSIFVLPPCSLQDLEQRLRNRRSDAEPAIRKRLEAAGREIQEAHRYRYAVVNDSLEQAVGDVLAIVRAARLQAERVLPRWRARFEMDENGAGS